MEAALQTYQKVARRQARDALIAEHLPLVRQVLRRMLRGLPERVDRDNLESAGLLGLVEAAQQFDPAQGTAFPVFATLRIRGAMLDELRRNCPLPQAVVRQWRVLRAAYARLNGPATPETLAEATGFSVEEVEACLEAVRMTRAEAWHDELADELPQRSDDGIPAWEQAEQLRVVAGLIERLPTQMRIAMTLYYRDGLRLKEIGEVLQLSESRVSRILSRAELQLREHLDRPRRNGSKS